MKVIRQYKLIGPYNYGMIIHNIEKNYAKRQLTPNMLIIIAPRQLAVLHRYFSATEV